MRGELQGRMGEGSVRAAGQEMHGVQHFTYAEGWTDAAGDGFLSGVVFGQKWYIIIGLASFPAPPATRVSAARLGEAAMGESAMRAAAGLSCFCVTSGARHGHIVPENNNIESREDCENFYSLIGT